VHQVNYAMERLANELVVVTDADARLDPSCVRELVTALASDPQTGIIGASVRVATALPEEQLHWWGINALWWLEGEALSAAVVSGVCYAARRTALLAAFPDARAEDVHLALRAAAQGLRVRISRTAWATEVRVPRDAYELLRFRRRRGADYLRELRRVPVTPLPTGVRVARWVRLFHFRVTPLLALITAGLALPLLGSAYWHWPVMAGIAFALPLAGLFNRSRLSGAEAASWSVIWTAGRLIGLLWVSLLTLRATRPAPALSSPAPARPAADLAPRPVSPAAGLVSIDQQVGS
jgi:cellulose synthase/poly-beta-1,6-N-acetylglucosamine synthase-like glycosyltransferase